MKYIAILEKTVHWRLYEDEEILTKSISDWSEVTDEEYKLLCQYLPLDKYVMLERVDKDPDFIPNTVKAAINLAKKQKQQLEQQKLDAEKKKQERLLKKKAKDAEAEKKLLQQLKEKYESSKVY